MAVHAEKYEEIIHELGDVKLVAVSKLKTVDEIKELYSLGQRDFGENYVQELTEKQAALPNDIRWHLIGHLQSNKVKYIAAFIHMIQSVDSVNLLKEINKQAAKAGRVIDVLLQMHIAQEETKFGLDEQELNRLLNSANEFRNVRMKGLMGMASFTAEQEQVRNEFRYLKWVFDKYGQESSQQFEILSMGMSGDYKIAIGEGSNMVRIGSLLFGNR